MLAFLPAPDPLTHPAVEPPAWRRLLLASAAIAGLASTQPWVRVQFDRLFGDHAGPPGWHCSAGFTCVCTCALVAMLALAETPAKVTHQATRPASLLLVTITALAFLLTWSEGPGLLRGVSAAWTWAFWLTAVCLPLLLLACTQRCRLLRPRRAPGM